MPRNPPAMPPMHGEPDVAPWLEDLPGGSLPGARTLCDGFPTAGAERETAERELRALEGAMEDLGLSRAMVVTAYERKCLKTPHGGIEVVPARNWLRTPARSFPMASDRRSRSR